MILNGLPWKQKEIILSFLRLHPSTAFQIFLLTIMASRVITLLTRVHVVKAMVFPVVMYRCESWIIQKAEHRRTDAFKLVLRKILESPLESKEIKPFSPKGNQLRVFTGRTDAEAEALILCPPDVKSQLIGKDPDTRKD